MVIRILKNCRKPKDIDSAEWILWNVGLNRKKRWYSLIELAKLAKVDYLRLRVFTSRGYGLSLRSQRSVRVAIKKLILSRAKRQKGVKIKT